MSNIQRRRNPVSGPASVAKPPMAAVNAAGITPKEAMGIMRRHILMIILFTLAGLIIGLGLFAYKRIYSPTYTARGALVVLPPVDEDPFDLRSQQTNKELFYQWRSTIAADMKSQRMLDKVIQDKEVRNTKWFKQFSTKGNFEWLWRVLGRPSDEISKAFDDLKKNLGVSPQRDTNLITVSMSCGSKEDSALIVGLFLNIVYEDRRDDARVEDTQELRDRKAALGKLNIELANIDKALDTLRKSSPNYGNLSQITFQDHLELKLSKIEILNDDLENQKSGLEEIINNLDRRATNDYDEVVRERIERDDIASNMRQRLSILETNLASLEARFGEGHRRIREARDAIEQARNDLAFRQKEIGDIERNADLIRAKEEMITLQARIEETRTRLGVAQKEHKGLSDLRSNYQKLEADRNNKKQSIEEMDKNIRALSARNDNDTQLSKLRPPPRADLIPKPRRMSSPSLKIHVIGGFVLGMFAGVGLAFGKELLNDILRSPSDVSKHLRVPLLGMISHTDEDDALGGVNIYHVVRQAPYSIMSECYRQLRTNLRLSEAGARHRSLLVTSCNSGCGKTTTATNLSATLVAEGMRVLLIDTNFRRPSLTGLFPRSEEEEEGSSGGADSGLSNYLLGQCSLEDVCRESGLEDLDIIDAGPLPSNPSELLNNTKMTELINQANTTYDYVIIDGPPLIVSDARILASQVDSTIVVFNAMSTRRGEAQRSLRELREINAEIAGTVLLGVRSMKGGYFQEVYKSYLQYQQVQIAGSVQ